MFWRLGRHRDDPRIPRVTVSRGTRDRRQPQVRLLRAAVQTPDVIDMPHRSGRLPADRGSRVVVHLPTGVARTHTGNAGDFVRAAWHPGVVVVVADMTTVRNWDDAGLASLRTAHGELVRRGAELRLVVWSDDLYAALQTAGVTDQLPVYANVDAALRDP